jgi:hypothetical protein
MDDSTTVLLIGFALAWFVGCICVCGVAERVGLNSGAWFFIALIGSPFLGAMLLIAAVIGDYTRPARREQERKLAERQQAFKEISTPAQL